MRDTTLLENRDSFEDSFYSSSGTYIHPTALVGPHVTLGTDVKIGPYAVLTGNITIGDQTEIHSHVIIGSSAQDRKVSGIIGAVQIGSGSIIKEFVTIHGPTRADRKTTIGNNCFLMNFSHVGHDATLEDHVTLTNNAQLGGHSHIEQNVLLMAGAAIHQFVRVGAYSAVAPFSGARQDLPPFCLYQGMPGAFAGLNKVALRRAGISTEEIGALKKIAALFYQKKLPFLEISEQAEQNQHEESNWGSSDYVRQFLLFIEQSKRGVSRKALTDARGSSHD